MRSFIRRFCAFFSLSLLAFGFLNSTAQAAISGIVFHDYNGNGQRDAGGVSSATDRGVGGVTVSAYGPSGACGTPATTSSASVTLGQYTLDTTGCPASPALLRIEITGLPTGYVAGKQSLASRGATLAATSAASSVQFVADGATDVEAAIQIPAEYCQNNPNYALPLQVFGNPTALANASLSTLGKLPYSGSGSDPLPTGDPAPITPDNLARSGQTGTLYGLAYDRLTDRLFGAAYMKRHAGLGSGGTGAIYSVSDASTGTPGTPAIYVDLNAVFGAGTAGTNTTRGDYEGALPGGDETWDEVGKRAFGDIEVSENGQTLYAINLNDRQLYRIPTSGTLDNTTVLRTPIPVAACANSGDSRPFALAVRGTTVYVGGVCSAQSTSNRTNLSAWIYSFDGTAFSASPLVQFALNYPRANADAGTPSDLTGNGIWQAWTSAEASPQNDQQWPEPMLTDITFDRGDMILGLRDRHGDQTGTGNATIRGITSGELLRACANSSGGWDLESNGACGSITGAVGAPGVDPAGNQARGPGSTSTGGEYYPLDHFDSGGFIFDSRFNGLHDETSQGALLQVPGFDTVGLTAMDPFRQNSGGMRWYSNSQPTNTALARGLQLFFTADPPGPFFAFSKANGLGDLQALCAPAPIEVGNYVWLDSDRDGLMDPDETPIANVRIELYSATGSLLGVATTSAQGEYYFEFNRGTDSNSNDNQILQTVNPFSGNYFLTIANTNFNVGGALENRSITSGFSSSSTLRDSNGIVGAVPVAGTLTHATLALGGAGNNDHSIDFGFGPIQFDFGDLPDTGAGTGTGNYETLLANNGARHIIDLRLHMGTNIDAETDGQPGAPATGDDTTGTPDDEDGVTSSLSFTRGSAASVTLLATNTIPATDATLCGFIDFNNDGDFDDTNETTSPGATVTTGTTNGSIALNFGAVPAGTANSSHARFRITTESPTCSSTGAVDDGEVEDYAVTIADAPTTLDFGDLPDTGAGTGTGNYETLLANNGPRHIIVAGLRLGGNIDAESDGQPNTSANGDDTTGIPDDEELSFTSISRDTILNLGIPVINSTGSQAQLCGFIDFNADGDFNDPNEIASVIIPTGTTVTPATQLAFGRVPLGPTVTSYARFRISTDTGSCSATGSATDGEVEDFTLSIIAPDLGDLPDLTSGTGPGDYQTLISNGGPQHDITPNLFMGAFVDGESDGQPGAPATGDDTTGTPDDEDGISAPLSFTRGSSASVTVSTINTTGTNATLCGFADFDANGDFSGTGETVSVTVPNGATSASLGFTVPAGTATSSYARFRIASAPFTCSSIGAVSTGEVEDYPITITAAPSTLDFGDLPDVGVGGYETLLANDGPRHTIVAGLYLGSTVDAETNGQPGSSAIDDDTTGSPDDEDGVTSSLSFTRGNTASVTLTATNTTGSAATVCGFIDFNNDGDFSDTNEIASAAVANGVTGATTNLSFGIVPAGLVLSSYARFRITTQTTGCVATGANTDGEVEDYTVAIAAAPSLLDFGDLPDTGAGTGTGTGNYETSLANNGPRHTIVPGLHFGTNIDAEANGQPGTPATGDDSTGTPDDEDGVTSALSFTRGSPASVTMTATNTTADSATICGYIDFNADGDFNDASESITTGVPMGASGGPFTLNFGVVPTTGTATSSYARFRIADKDTTCSENGLMSDGEVEDYAVTIGTSVPGITPTAVPGNNVFALLLLGLLLTISSWLSLRRTT